jgi:hypothetical protein
MGTGEHDASIQRVFVNKVLGQKILHLYLFNNFGIQLAFTGLSLDRSDYIHLYCLLGFPTLSDLHKTPIFLLIFFRLYHLCLSEQYQRYQLLEISYTSSADYSYDFEFMCS